MRKGEDKTNKVNNKTLEGPKDPLQKDIKPARKAKTKKPILQADSSPIQSDFNNDKDEIPTSKTTNMEVHHHPELKHKPKPFKEYLLEGFMIFIAVMMGFIAENIRQAIDDNEHVKQLTVQLVNDLKTDTAQLNNTHREEMKIASFNDTLLNLLQQPLQKADTRKIQKLVAESHSMWLFHPSAGAMTAIKNELHLKQFSNSELISYFSKYEKNIELLHTAQDVNLQYQRTYLDPFLTQHFTPGNIVASFGESSMPNRQMRNITQGDIDQLAADIVLIRIVTNEMITHIGELKADATDFLNYVTTHYHLENGRNNKGKLN